MKIKIKIIILSLLLVLSCKKTNIPKESSHVFKLPQKNVFIKTSKFRGGKFTLAFARDSLLFKNETDFIEFKTGSFIQIIFDSTNIFVSPSTSVINKVDDVFKVQMVTDSIFNSFFINNNRKYPYTFISIDTDEYGVVINERIFKKGDLYGGW